MRQRQRQTNRERQKDRQTERNTIKDNERGTYTETERDPMERIEFENGLNGSQGNNPLIMCNGSAEILASFD